LCQTIGATHQARPRRQLRDMLQEPDAHRVERPLAPREEIYLRDQLGDGDTFFGS